MSLGGVSLGRGVDAFVKAGRIEGGRGAGVQRSTLHFDRGREDDPCARDAGKVASFERDDSEDDAGADAGKVGAL